MKKDNNLAAKRPLKRLFFRNYLAISGLLLGTIFVSLLLSDVLMNRFISAGPEYSQLRGEALYDAAAGRFDTQLLERHGGWFELIDDHGVILAVEGVKEDAIDRYSREQLLAQLDFLRNEDGIAYHAFAVEGAGGEPYVLLWKVPEPWWQISLALIIFAALCVMLLLVALYYYTRFSTRQVKEPLRHIVEGIKEMERYHYDKRLELSAEQEIADIQEAFNKLAQRLQHTSTERDRAETNKRNMLLHLSHDLKTPVTSVFGYSKLLLDNRTLKEQDKYKYIQYIYDKSSYMADLIHDLFELAKLDDDRLQLHLERVNIAHWFQGLVAEFYPELEEKGFRLEARMTEAPLFVSLDKMRMNRVVTNLISNALKYNEPGTTIYASCDKAGDQAVLCIGDNGAGVEEELKEQLFDEFIRPSGSAAKDSTGLGLVICKKIVTLHRGTIELRTDPPYSALFTITLPCTGTEGNR